MFASTAREKCSHNIFRLFSSTRRASRPWLKPLLEAVGFEPTPPERLEPKSSTLDHSATLPRFFFLSFHPPEIEATLAAEILHKNHRVRPRKALCSAMAATRVFQKGCPGSGGIQTHAPEETGALIQRLRPLGHATLWVLFHGSLRPVESPDADFANKAAV